jgi:hypothetical protein
VASESRPWRPVDTEVLAEAWIGAARAVADWWLDHPDLSAEAVSNRFLDFVLAGVHGLCQPA